MVWKIVKSFILCVVLMSAISTIAHAETHTVYEGTISSTYTTYFKDILSGVSFTDNYVAFRSGQNEYTMVVGDLDINNKTISLSGHGKSYVFYTESSSGYNNQQRYKTNDISNFSVNVGNYIIYSDIGDFPQLMERGAKYEILSTVLIIITLLCIVINRIFFRR